MYSKARHEAIQCSNRSFTRSALTRYSSVDVIFGRNFLCVLRKNGVHGPVYVIGKFPNFITQGGDDCTLVVDTHRQHHENIGVWCTSSIARKYIAHIEACLHEYKSMPVIFFFVVQTMSCRLSLAQLQAQVSCKHIRIYCGLLGVSLLTRTHLVQVQKNTFRGANWICRLRQRLCSYKEDAHTVACWVSPTAWPRHRVTRRTHTHTHTLWLAGCLLLVNCKTHLALIFVVQTGVAD